MGFNLPDFLNARLVSTGLQNAGQNLQQGMALPGYKKALDQQRLAQELANKLQATRLPYEEQRLRQEEEKRGLDSDYVRKQLEQLGISNEQARMLFNIKKQIFDEMNPFNQGAQAQANPMQDQNAQMGVQDMQASGMQQGVPAGSEGAPTSSAASTIQGASKYDELWKNNPIIRDQFPGTSVTTKIDPASGQAYEIYKLPSGKIEYKAVQAGKTPYEREFEKGLASNAVEQLKVNDAAFQNGMEQQGNFEALDKIIGENIELFKDTTGPLQSRLSPYLSSKEVQDMYGRLQAILGNIKLTAAKDIKGAFTGRDQQMIDDLKPNVSDTPAVFYAKLQALKGVHEMMQNRRKMISNLVRNGTDPVTAASFAVEAFPVKGIEQTFEQARLKRYYDGQEWQFNTVQEAKKFDQKISNAMKGRGVIGG